MFSDVEKDIISNSDFSEQKKNTALPWKGNAKVNIPKQELQLN